MTTTDSPDALTQSLDDLYRRPGFLIRRAHQIAVSIFLEETAPLGLTTTQYGALVILRASEDLDQVGLARLGGIDRSTTALVISKLEAAGYVERVGDPKDRRRRMLRMTKAGHEILARVAAPAERALQRALGAFTPAEADQFLHLMRKFVTTFNEDARAPIMGGGQDEAEPSGPAP